VLISNTSSDPIANATLETAMSKVIEENVCTLTNQVKELQEGVMQLEQENTQLNDQLGASTSRMTTLDDFRKCALDQAGELHKTRQNLGIHI